jgi:CRP/FNR family transcriptional regulator, cyclic AMP receptor protein
MTLELTAVNALGYAASVAVLATFCMNTMIPLRIAALGSNVLFMAYGYADHLYPVFVLHAILLPVNALRLVQFQRLLRELRDAHRKDFSIQNLLPYMTRKKFAAGEPLMARGESADRLYYLVHGELEVTEFNKVLKPGAIVGEIGVFAVNQLRTATVVCRTDCSLLELVDYKAKQLYFQDPLFSFAILRVIIARLMENNERLMEVMAQTEINKGAETTA